MDNTTTLYALLAIATLLYAPSAWRALVNNYKLRPIPTAGSGFWTSYLGALRFFRNAPSMVQEGYDKLLHTDLTGPDLSKNRYHVEVVKLLLTRNIGSKFADVQDEIETAFHDHIKFQGNEWTTVVPFPKIMDIVCRASNRMFVDLPLSHTQYRDPAYIQLNKQYTIDLVKTARMLGLFPSFLRPFVIWLLLNLSRDLERGYKHLEPIFQDRLKQEARLGKDRPERPNDAISWLIEYSDPEQSEAERIKNMVIRMLQINFAAIHTTTMSFTHVLYDLVTRPEYVQPMREEVEGVIREEGWSKISIGKLNKLDSFIKESLRLSGFLLFSMQRKVMKDFTFSNGMTIPAGNTMGVPLAIHFDSEYYAAPDSFDGFRFEKMRNREGMENKHQIVSLDLNHILFGHGRHACPGWFFAANELKVMLAHILINYDVEMANGGGRPANWLVGSAAIPDLTVKVMFRKRV